MLPQRVLLSALVLMLAQSAQVSDGAKILGLFPFPATSHLTIMTSLAKGLASKGHEVTVVVPVKSDKLPPNYRELVTNFTRKEIIGEKGLDMFSMREVPFYIMLPVMWTMGGAVCDAFTKSPSVQELIHSKEEKFDVIIVEAFFNECLLGFSHTFQAPIVQLCSFGGAEWMTAAVGNPHYYAYMPDFLTNFNERMTFLERVQNTIMGLFGKLGRAVYYMPKQNQIMQKAFAGTGPGPMPHVSELDSQTALVLLNQHVSLGYPRPLLPNVIDVGGLHIKTPKKLSKDLQEYLDSATEGVVYFSMGSNLQSTNMPVEKRDALLKAFSKLKMKVLWKWEEDVLPEQPKNVKLGKWLPQSDLLAHPNVKVFITHGGLLSTQEAVYHGVPVIGIPVFGDQYMNIKGAVAAGYGYFLDFQSIDKEEVILKAINTVLSDPTYRNNAQQISRIFRDQPRLPLDNAIYWTEYVIRHKGATHMRSGALDLTWYQYYLLDIFAVIAGGALIALIVLRLALKALWGLVCKKKPAVEDSKKKN